MTSCFTWSKKQSGQSEANQAVTIEELPLMLILWSMCRGRTFINEEPLKLIETLGRFGKQVDLASLMREIKDEEINNLIM
jgi:hypothetical protein